MSLDENEAWIAYTVIDGYLADRAANWLAEQIELSDPASPEPHIGRVDAAAWLEGLFASVDNPDLAEVRLTVDVGRVAAEWLLMGLDHSSGAPVRIPMASVYDIEDRQIVRARLYYDPAALPVHHLEKRRN